MHYINQEWSYAYLHDWLFVNDYIKLNVETSFAQRALCVRWMKRIYDEFDDEELNVIERLNTFIKSSMMDEWMKH